MINRIVVGSDRSVQSLAAVRWAAEIARLTDAQVLVVHAVPLLLEVSFAIPPLHRVPVLDEAAAELAGPITEYLRDAGVRYEVRLVEDHPATALLDSAADTSADILVVGRHGHSRWARNLLGGVAHKVLHGSHVPLVVVPQDRRGWGGAGDPGALTVGVDGGDGSEATLEWATVMASWIGSPVGAVTVATASGFIESTWSGQVAEADALAEAEKLLTEIADRVEERFDTRIRRTVRAGSPAQVLVEEAETAAMLVVGCARRPAVIEAMTGSVAQYAASWARCPVAVVPHTHEP